MTADSRPTLEARRNQIDARLADLLRHAAGCPAVLREAVEYSLLGPGKRLRPLLALLAAEAGGGTAEAALPAGCAVEMVHTYSLVHDDLPAMDDDHVRRGRPTCHKKFGEALAILAGDALLTLAFQVLAAEYPPATGAACCRELAAAAGPCGMVGGQVEDLTWDGKIAGSRESVTVADLERTHVRKTGALFLASLRLGLLTAQGERPGGPEPPMRDALETFGRSFGLAFQISDDLLDVQGDPAVAGKRVGKDAGRKKLTYPGLIGCEESRVRLEALARQAEEAVRPLGPAGADLADLVRRIVTRDR